MMLGARTGAWAKAGTIPSGWVEVEWVRSTYGGSVTLMPTTYIDTGVVGNVPMKFKAKVLFPEVVDNSAFFGARNGTNGRFQGGTSPAGPTAGHFAVGYGSSLYYYGNVTKETLYDLSFDYKVGSQKFSINESDTYEHHSTESITTNRNIWLFACNSTTGWHGTGDVMIYSFEIEGLRNFVGVRNITNDEVAMCDILTGEIYHNAGSEAFTCGPDKT